MIENNHFTFTYVMETYADLVTRIAVLRLGNRQDAKDIFQNVFLKLYEKDIAFQDEEHVKAWLIQVTTHACIDEKRKFWKLHRVDYDDAFYGVEDKEEFQLLCYFMKLPVNIRNALYLYYYEGYHIQEIAVLMNAKENTVKSWMRRGREALRDMIGGDYHE